MNDLSRLLDALSAAQAEGQDAVIATVVKVEGSAYRRPGARMVIPQLGSATGTVSGGCLESDVSKKAWWLTATGKPAIRTYSTGEDDDELEDAELSFGLGCNGTVHILFERVVLGTPSLPVSLLQQVRESQQPAALATVIASESAHYAIGERVALAPVDGLVSEVREPALAANIASDLQTVLNLGRSSTHVYAGKGGAVEVLLEFIPAPRRLVIFGAGHDAAPLTGMARLQGWHTTVVDARPHFARAERFPDVDQVMAVALGEPLPAILDGAAVVVMTHSYSQDRHWLATALRAKPVYIGQLGPRSRTERLLAEMDEHLQTEPAFAGLHYPVGLDLGGDAPESVALSILAEINAVANRRNGGMLKHRVASIHGLETAIKPDQALRAVGQE